MKNAHKSVIELRDYIHELYVSGHINYDELDYMLVRIFHIRRDLE